MLNRLALLLSPFLYFAAVSANACGDCIKHDVSSQLSCKMKVKDATYDARWHQGLSTNVDQKVLKGEIVAYKIKWFNGTWSSWYVPGVNDIDGKVNLGNSAPDNTLRRKWSNFYDHTHRYILCK